jgi:hypothetical protein
MKNAERIAYLAGLVPQICRAHGWDVEKLTTFTVMGVARATPTMHLHLDAGEAGDLPSYIVSAKSDRPYVVATGTHMEVEFAAFLPLPVAVAAESAS